ncbi:MAG: alpha/beta hydrolase [Acidimicrobiia bacterium]|nr:alpha/beta hydrolase [Acidimicrobiia bacterium]MBT8202551.1 alpha/beta hydrolase [Acidimicrobiia bacterium]NNF11310.1 alpha/beta hydrolase [Acidimicrobiia bacterium]NNL71376.1 alpha/beta hydrolase [Acidimicrobiia bacterium]
MTVELARIEWGSGDRRLLVVHGVGSNADGWWRVGPALADAGFHVVAVDLRGHGSSDTPDDYSIGAYAADLLALADRWDVVLGHSLGGAAVVEAITGRPEWTNRLILEDPMLVILDEEIAVEYVTSDLGPHVTLDMVQAANPTWHPEDARIKLEAQNAAGWRVIEDSMRHNPGWNVVAEVAAITIPTLLLGADPDLGPLVPPALGQSLAEMNPNIEFYTLAGASHSMHRDEFDAFMAVVLDFVTQTP